MVLSPNTPRIIRTETAPGVLEIHLLDNGILEMNWNEKLTVIQKSDLQNAKRIIENLSAGKLMPVYVSTFNFMNISEDAKKYAASDEAQEFTLANAVLIDNLGKKILFNFFVSINKPSRPTKGFSTREKAFEWLLMMKKKTI